MTDLKRRNYFAYTKKFSLKRVPEWKQTGDIVAFSIVKLYHFNSLESFFLYQLQGTNTKINNPTTNSDYAVIAFYEYSVLVTKVDQIHGK